MKRFFTAVIALTTILAASAQFLASAPSGKPAATETVAWSVNMKMTAPTVGIVTITADIRDGWHIYGTKSVKNGPVATAFSFDKLVNASLIGKTAQSKKPSKHFDSSFNTKVYWWEGKVVFTQKFRVADQSKPFSISGHVTYMACSAKTCMAPKKFEFSVKQD